MTGTEAKVAVIGAGPIGLAMAKALKDRGVAYAQFDAAEAIGGNWHHGVYETAHIISSRKATEYADFPMPGHYPDFPSREQMLAYLNAYADAFGLRSAIRLNCKVIYARPVAENRWELTFEGGAREVYKALVACTGHHWDRRWPDYPGRFTGEMLHSKDYRGPEQLRGKRVLVIGGGNSACDIVSEAARVGTEAHLSLRRGYWFLPKTIMGLPVTDLPLAASMPVSMQRLVLRAALRIAVGRYQDYGLPRPDHRIFERHPTLNSELLHYLKHGRIAPHGDIARFEGKRVQFRDGDEIEVDAVVAATGFHLSWPFLPEGLVKQRGVVPEVYGGSMLADYRNLYLVGWAQARYGFGPLVTPGCALLAELIVRQDGLRHGIGAILKAMGEKPPRTHLVDPFKVLRQIRRARRRLFLLPLMDRRLSRKQAAAANPVLAPPPDIADRHAALRVY